MSFSFRTDVPAFPRTYKQLNDDSGLVSIGDVEAIVVHDPFWIKFAAGWEPETERIYRQLIKPGSTVLDIGAWIGSTILFALACGAEKIIALEPNPESYEIIRKFIQSNPNYSKRIELTNRAVSNRREMLSMGLAEGESDTSTSGIAGNDFEVEAITLNDIIAEYALNQIDLVKIDIEGAEVFLWEALSGLSFRPGQTVHLSVHVSFFPEGVSRQAFVDSLRGFGIYDDRGEELTQSQFENRILSSESHPDWGTKHGNFFEVLLLAD